MSAQKIEREVETKHLLTIERDAIEFAQSIFKGSRGKQKDPLTKIERDAISYAKQLLSKFARSDDNNSK